MWPEGGQCPTLAGFLQPCGSVSLVWLGSVASSRDFRPWELQRSQLCEPRSDSPAPVATCCPLCLRSYSPAWGTHCQEQVQEQCASRLSPCAQNHSHGSPFCVPNGTQALVLLQTKLLLRTGRPLHVSSATKDDLLALTVRSTCHQGLCKAGEALKCRLWTVGHGPWVTCGAFAGGFYSTDCSHDGVFFFPAAKSLLKKTNKQTKTKTPQQQKEAKKEGRKATKSLNAFQILLLHVNNCCTCLKMWFDHHGEGRRCVVVARREISMRLSLLTCSTPWIWARESMA